MRVHMRTVDASCAFDIDAKASVYFLVVNCSQLLR